MDCKSEPRLRLRVTAAAEGAVRGGHPWLFAGSIREQNRPGMPGELAIIYDRRDGFLALGLYDPDSPLRVRILHTGDSITIDRSWWKQRLAAAVERRANLFDSQTTGYRCIHGESDGWPGLVLDRYDSTYVLKLYTGAWLPRLPEIVPLLEEQFRPKRIVLRLSRNIQKSATKAGLTEGQILTGLNLKEPVTFLENGLRFEADVVRGQKTGFFLDQRENRRQVESLAGGRTVLNAFSFSGGFSVYAARGGARSVLDLDISAHALESARRNFRLNASIPNVARCHHEAIKADAFGWLLDCAGRKFDLVVIDPPALAKNQSERPQAMRAYRKLLTAGIKSLQAGGILVAASCSAPVPNSEFFDLALKTAKASGRNFREVLRTEEPPDHRASFPEGKYLKCIYLHESSRAGIEMINRTAGSRRAKRSGPLRSGA